jgi:hypothetical protein
VVVVGILLGMLIIAVAGGFDFGPTPVGLVIGIVAGLTAIVASLIATRNQRKAARIDLWVATITPLCVVAFSWEFGSMVWSAAIFLGALVIPGFFWRFAACRGWPALLPKSFWSCHPWLKAAMGIGLSGVLAVGASFWFLALPWFPPIGDCGGRTLLDEHGIPRGIDFTARIIFVGPRTCWGRSLWSLASVDERFSGLASEVPDLVLLRGFFQPHDRFRRYFVEGQRNSGVLTCILPIIEPDPCGRTAPIDNDFAAAALRTLRDRAAKADRSPK